MATHSASKEVTMGILSRAVRLCKADLHGVMDQMEDRDLLLRQHLREMQAAMADGQNRIDGLEEALQAVRRDRSAADRQRQALEEDVDRAVARGQDDIARMLIRKLLPLRKRIDGMAYRREELETQLEEERQRLGDRHVAYDAIRLRVAAAREHAGRTARMPDMAPAEAELRRWPPSEEEIEWELLQRKEAAGEGRTT
jgi:phage shock protein A